MKIVLTLIALLAMTLGAQAQKCNLQNWPCALHRTNAELTTIQLPTPLPFSGLIGANTTWQATPYGTTVLRCTDVNSNATSTLHHSYEVQDSGGAGFSEWNADGTLLKILNADQGVTNVMQVDPVHHKCLGFLPNSTAPDGSVFDELNPDVDYYLGSPTNSVVYTRNGFHNPQGPTTIRLVDLLTICDFGKPLPIKFYWHAPLTTLIQGKDTILVTSFSTQNAQDTGQFLVAYDVIRNGCQVIDTQAMVSRGSNYGQSGKTTGTNGVFPFFIHDTNATRGGWATTGGDNCTGCPALHGPYLWKVGTTTMNLTTEAATGHEVLGVVTEANLTDSPKMAARLASSVNTFSYITSAQNVKFPGPQDTHCGWRNVDWPETRPFFCSQVSQDQPFPLLISAPLQQEVYGVDKATGTYISLSPTFTSGIPNKFNFRSQNAIIAVSSYGAKVPAVAWSSDAMGGLGNSDGVTPHCILGADKPNECRSDVFIVFP